MLALIMKTYIKSFVTGALGTAAWLVVGAGNVQAQDRPAPGNFDPQQMRQRMTERMRDQLDVKEDAEWKAIAERIDKLMEARRSAGGIGAVRGPGFPGGPGGFGGPGGPPPRGGERRPDAFGPPGDTPGALRTAPGRSPGAG